MLLLAVEHYGYVAGGLSNASSVQQLAALAFILCVSRLVLFYLKRDVLFRLGYSGISLSSGCCICCRWLENMASSSSFVECRREVAAQVLAYFR